MGNRIHILAVGRASEIAGGATALAFYLKVTPATVATWLQGTGEVPLWAFLKVVEVIVERPAVRLQGATEAWEAAEFRHRVAANW